MESLIKFVFLIFTLSTAFAQDDPVVSTIYGDIRGQTRRTVVGAAFDEFLGVPYATPPIGDLRWRKPVPPESWDGVRETRQFGRKCTQMADFAASEDCLYLNVYVPGSVKGLVSKNEKLPVLFYIHGGAFIYGSASNYDGGLLSTKGQVVLVTTNYRLSTIGFFSTESDAAPGNFGLWDQIAALEWVHDNIASFGGDVSRLTVMGQSAGSASVSHLSLSPAAKGLFQRVITLSGSSASYFGATPRQRVTSTSLANHFNCPTSSDEEAVDCLRQESAFTLDLLGLVYPPLTDAYLCSQIPVVDGELVSVKPIDGMAAGLNADYDLLAGTTRHDVAPFALPFTATVENVNSLLNFLFNVYQNRDELVSLLLERYPEVLSEDLDIRQKVLIKIGTDLIFSSRTLKEAELHQQTSSRNTFVYEFRHQYNSIDPPWLQGVHGEDLPFIFGRDSMEGEHLQLSEYIQSYYCNFVYTGNPNKGPHAVPVEWPQYDLNNYSRMVQSLEPFVENIPEDLLEDFEFCNDLYDMAIPRDSDADISSLYPEMLRMWNTLAKEIEKLYK